MTGGLVVGRRRIPPVGLLAILIGLATFVALIAPEPTSTESPARSTHSTAAGGVRIVYELAQKLGWQPSRREAPLAASDAPAVHVVLSPQEALGAVEVHRLLESVRHGGGLIFDIDGADEIADSIGVDVGETLVGLAGLGDASCVGAQSFRERAALVLPPTVHDIRWRRPPPGVITQIRIGDPSRRHVVAGAAFPMGQGRVAAMTSSSLFMNSAVRTCGWGTDVATVRALEYVRPASPLHPRLVFDEYHHGYGAHGGSIHAVALFLSHTASGHFLGQALIAAFILLLAKAPRPIVPREPERIPRRSPLEHADALAHAYADVGATKTATSRLVSGLRRRAGRTVPVPASANDAAFLTGVEERSPALAPSVSVVRRALAEPLARRELAAVSDAVRDIERGLTTSPPSRS